MRRVAIAILLLLGCTRPTERSAPRVGLVTGLTGPTAAWGEAIRRGAQMAADERGIQLVIEDDQGSPQQTANAAQKLADGVIAIVGADTSGGTLAASPICERAKIPLVTPTASAPSVTMGKRYTFRVCATDDLEAIAAARLARERLHARRVVILRDTKNDYSTGMTAAFSRELPPVRVLDYAAGDSDFRAQLTTALADKPDVLFVPGYYGDVAQIAAQARDLGYTAPLLGGSGWDSPKLLEIGGKALEGCWFVSWPRALAPEFVRKFRERHGTTPDAASAQAYDAVALIADAMKRGGNLRDAIAATKSLAGASGPITIRPDNNAEKSLAVYRVAGGNFLEEGSIR